MRRETRKVLEVLGIQQINTSKEGLGCENHNMGFSSNINNKKKKEDGVQFLNSNMNHKDEKHENHYQELKRDEEEITTILTLPTILTLGRVAAVPLLVS
ncbi:hypothetical protein MKX03_013712, partial [Papaver bracteatum]